MRQIPIRLNTIVKRDASGNFSAGTITANLTGNVTGSLSGNATTATTATSATNFSGSLAGDVTGTQAATTVSSVGGQSAANVASGVVAANNATNTNTPNTIVKRDASGNFSAGTITPTLSGNASTATALAANGTNCTAGSYPLGVDASGNAEGCTVAGGGTADTTAPVPGSSGTITATNSGTDIVLSWTAATDNVTPQSNLEYTVFYSKSNTINTVTNAEANGTPFGFSWSTNITTKTVSGLTVGTTYYFNVAVKDAGHNNAMYTTVSKAPSVPASDIILYVAGTTYNGNLGGRSGANAKCNASANKPAGYTNFAAFISVNATDTIFGRQAFSGLSTSTAIRSTNGTLIANNWTDLLDGSIANTLVAAGINVGSNGWNSGSNADGTLGDTCNAWTVNTAFATSGYLEDWGSGGSTTATWIYNSTNKDGCNILADILCIAW